MNPDEEIVHIILIHFHVKIKVDRKGNVYVTAPNQLQGLEGLCGNNDGIANSELGFHHFKPFVPSVTLTHICPVDFSILISWTSPFVINGCQVNVFIFVMYIMVEIHVSKQCRPWSDAAVCCVWTGSILFAYVSQKCFNKSMFPGCLLAIRYKCLSHQSRQTTSPLKLILTKEHI